MNKVDDIYIGILLTALHDVLRCYDSVSSPEDNDRIMMSFISCSITRFSKFGKGKQQFIVDKTKRIINSLLEDQ